MADRVITSFDIWDCETPPGLLGGVQVEFVIGTEANKKFTKTVTTANGGPAACDEPPGTATDTDTAGYVKLSKAGYSTLTISVTWEWVNNGSGKTARLKGPFQVTYCAAVQPVACGGE